MEKNFKNEIILKKFEKKTKFKAARLGAVPQEFPNEFTAPSRVLNSSHLPQLHETVESPGPDNNLRNFEATLLQVFDRMGPHVSLIRMQPKGMPK